MQSVREKLLKEMKKEIPVLISSTPFFPAFFLLLFLTF